MANLMPHNAEATVQMCVEGFGSGIAARANSVVVNANTGISLLEAHTSDKMRDMPNKDIGGAPNAIRHLSK